MDIDNERAKALTAQALADEAERAAIERYLALRAAFWPCWGRLNWPAATKRRSVDAT